MTRNRRTEVPPPTVDDFVEGPGLALVEFWASWSGESFLVGGAVERLLRARPDLAIRVGRVDCDAHPEVCARYHATCPPVLLLFRDGELLARHHGLIAGKDLSEWITHSPQPPGQ